MLRKLLPFSRITMLLWAWRNRASVLEWAAFALRAVSAGVSGRGVRDAATEFRLRANLARDPLTRHAIINVSVHNGIAHLAGRVSPEVHARIQDIAVATKGVKRLDDRLTHTLGKAGLLKRRARVA